jgi:hypothetical protein
MIVTLCACLLVFQACRKPQMPESQTLAQTEYVTHPAAGHSMFVLYMNICICLHAYLPHVPHCCVCAACAGCHPRHVCSNRNVQGKVRGTQARGCAVCWAVERHCRWNSTQFKQHCGNQGKDRTMISTLCVAMIASVQKGVCKQVKQINTCHPHNWRHCSCRLCLGFSFSELPKSRLPCGRNGSLLQQFRSNLS